MSRSLPRGEVVGDLPHGVNHALVRILADMVEAALKRDDANATSRVESTAKATIERGRRE